VNLIAAFDVGTTAVKGVLVNERGEAVFSKKINIDTSYVGGFVEQNPEEWYDAFCSIAQDFVSGFCRAEEITGIIMSGQMQDVILLDADRNAIGNAILYSDNRAVREAAELVRKTGREQIYRITGNEINGTSPLAKMTWLKTHNPEMLDRAKSVLFCAKDFCTAKLTDQIVVDATAASTVGAMDLRQKQWNDGLIAAAGVDRALFPSIGYAHQLAGIVTKEAQARCGFAAGTPVYIGTGDAGATTLASGISKNGEFNINIGTSGWVACVDSALEPIEGVFHLAAVQEHTYLSVVPFLNAGSVHKWIAQIISPDADENKYQFLTELLKNRTCGSNGFLFLPYLVGERFPIMDGETRGCFIGATPETGKTDFVSACLEGVALSIRQGISVFHTVPKRITMIGGGVNDADWCQIFADVLGAPIETFPQSEFMPAISIATSAMLGQGRIADYDDFLSRLQKDNKMFFPIAQNAAVYDKLYERFIQIYPAVKGLFRAT